MLDACMAQCVGVDRIQFVDTAIKHGLCDDVELVIQPSPNQSSGRRIRWGGLPNVTRPMIQQFFHQVRGRDPVVQPFLGTTVSMLDACMAHSALISPEFSPWTLPLHVVYAMMPNS